MLQGEHSAIFSTFIKLPFVIKIFVLSVAEWSLKTGFTVHVVAIQSLKSLRFHFTYARVGISGTTAKSRQRKFVPSSHTGPFALVASPGKSKTKVGTLACFDFL